MNIIITILTCALAVPTLLVAQEKKDDNVTSSDKKEAAATSSNNKEEGNRNVMLNAASANGPREISIGLPGGDVNVLENGLPVVYLTNPHNVSTHWRGDCSLEHSGLLKISETAITTGNIGYAVNSFTQLGVGNEGISGTLNYNTNHFGKHQFDVNVNGGMGNGWYYSGSVYQNFDPGSFDLKFTPYQDRTQIFKAALTKRYSQGRGQVSLIYHFSESHNLNNVGNSAPFIYNGDGSVSEIPGFSLGTSCYLPNQANITYMDIRTGKVKTISLYDASTNRANQWTLLNTYKWDNGLEWKANLKYKHAMASCLYQTPMGLSKADATSGYSLLQQDGTLGTYTGDVQSRMSCFNRGTADDLMLTTELQRGTSAHTWRVGLNEWYYHIDYASNTTMYDHTVGNYPERLYGTSSAATHYYGSTPFYNFNQNASEYYKGFENKLALYATHDWNITDRLNAYYGARLEWQHLEGENLAVQNADGKFVGRFANYYIGATAPDGTKIAPRDFSYNWFNFNFTAALTYKLTDQFGFTGDFTYINQRPNMSNYAPAEMPNTNRISVPLGRAGIYFNNSWISLTSLVSYIAKTNNNSTLNLINPNDPSGKDVKAAPLVYDIQTIGWTTDAVVKPFRGFELHALFTYQKPTYKKYETGVTFSDGSVSNINATGNIVAEIPEVLIELDPSYMITKDLRIWASFRYFSKTYANINDAYYFDGRWETFGGVNWTVNKHLSLGATVINFLNQTGAKGSISGAELVTKEEAGKYAGALLSGSYIRPFTVEFSASIKF